MHIKTPDIGVDKATVAEILVKVGDRIAVEDSVVLLESDKASVEVPSPAAGMVKSISVSLGDEVNEGSVLLELEAEDAASTAADAVQQTAENTATALPDQEIMPELASHQPAASASVEVKLPDIGVEKALVGEILVSIGDHIEIDQSIVVVESDKATVEVPSSVAGIVESIEVHEGDTVKEGVLLIKVKVAGLTAQAEVTAEPAKVTPAETRPIQAEAEAESAPAASAVIEINVPDLGVDKATVAEILVQVGDRVEADQSIIVVESDKATVEVPSSIAGMIKAIHVSVGQSVSQGAALLSIEGQAPASVQATKVAAAEKIAAKAEAVPEKAVALTQKAQAPITASGADKLTQAENAANAEVYAGPAVRKLARELGVVLAKVQASGAHERVMKEDVFAYVKTRLTTAQVVPVAQAVAAASLPKLPDFSAFGEYYFGFIFGICTWR